VSEEHLYVVVYDIADDRRWRAIFRLMNGYGEWLQLSVFQCRLGAARRAELAQQLLSTINSAEDHAMIIDVGPADGVEPRVQSLGKRKFDPIERAPVIV